VPKFVAHLIALRRGLQPLDGRWYDGLVSGAGLPDLTWLQPRGASLSVADWQDGQQRALGVLIGAPGRASQPLVLLFNAQHEDVEFALPPGRWRVLIDSVSPNATGKCNDHTTWPLPAHGAALLQLAPE
jgi:pullulanase/glycogen debranching enzyme